MQGHLSVLYRKDPFVLVGFIDAEHGAVGVEDGAVGPVCREAGRRLRLYSGDLKAGTLHGGKSMCRIQVLDGLDPAEALDLAVDAFEGAVGKEHAAPGVLVFAGHVVVRMVAGNDHQGTQDHLCIAGFLYGLDDIFTGGLLRLALDGADEDIFIAEAVDLRLHLAVADLGRVGGTVPHENKGRAVPGRFFRRLIAGFFHGFLCDGLCDSLLIGIDLRSVLAYLSEQGLRNGNSGKTSLMLRKGILQLVILCTVHQVRGLDDKVLNAVFLCTDKGLLHVVDALAVPGQDVIEDDLGCERTADRPVGICLLQGVLDAFDITCTAVIEGRAEADDEELIFADLIKVPGIIEGGIARIPSEIIGIGVFPFDQCLFFLSQRIPGGPCRSALFLRRVSPFLDIDGIDEGSCLFHGFHVGTFRSFLCSGIRRRCPF